jgi:hypothetical protein
MCRLGSYPPFPQTGAHQTHPTRRSMTTSGRTHGVHNSCRCCWVRGIVGRQTAYKLSSSAVSCLRVAGRCVYEPDGTPIVVNRVPDAPATGDLDLPLLKAVTLDYLRSEITMEWSMPVVRTGSWVGPHLPPCVRCVARGLLTECFPALCSFAGAEPHVPFVRTGGGCDPVSPFRAHPALGSGTGP